MKYMNQLFGISHIITNELKFQLSISQSILENYSLKKLD